MVCRLFNCDALKPRARGESLLQLHKPGKIGVIERVGLTEIAAGVKLVEPNVMSGRAFLKKENYSFDARTLERAAGTVEHRMQITAF